MIIPIPLIGLAFAGSKLLPRLSHRPSTRGTKAALRFRARRRASPRPGTKKAQKNPVITPVPQLLQNMMKGLSTSLTKITQKPQRENYEEIVRGFMPKSAQLLTPQSPMPMGKIQFADLDGDAKSELITSYRGSDGIRTLVLKKHGERWDKISEIYNPHFDAIHHLSFSDITGEGRKQLLLGGKTKNGNGELHGYSFQNDRTYELFAQNYNRLEVLEADPGKGTRTKPRIALWKIPGNHVHTIDVMEWNGSGLSPVQNPSSYYRSRVLPYYAQKVKQMPQNPAHWYHLSNMLEKSRMYADAVTAAEAGMRLSPVSPSMEEFTALKNRILSQMK